MSKKFNKKKNTRNNYRIESLEPRLMMDATIDYMQFLSNYEQVDSIVGTQLDRLQTPNLSELGIEDGIQSIKDALSDLGGEAETATEWLIHSLRDGRISIFLQFNTLPAVRESRRDKLSQSFRSTRFLHVPAINIPVPETLSCFFAERGRFAKQTMERSDFVCVRNAPRSKHTYRKRF